MKAVLRASLVVLGSAFLLSGAPASAKEASPPMIVGPGEDFVTYATFAKLESNISEATLNVFLLSWVKGQAERKAVLADFENDVEAIKIYTGQLASMKLSSEATTALNEFKKHWAVFEKKARATIAKGSNVMVKELHELYTMASKMDDHIDDTLMMLRKKMKKAAS
jgi:hypothetical protein